MSSYPDLHLYIDGEKITRLYGNWWHVAALTEGTHELMVEISANGNIGRMQAKLTDLIHPEAVFMLHGFGHRLPVESRAFGKGVADHELMCGGLDKWDKAGGAIAYQEHFVKVSKAS